MTILILMVNYHSGADAARFTRDIIANLSTHQWHLRIVDNSTPADPELDELAELHSNIRVLHSERNLGYFAAAAWGLADFLRDAAQPDWVMVANADLRMPVPWTVLPEPSTDCAVIAPAITSTFDDKNQNPYMRRRPSTQRMQFLNRVASRYWLAQAYFLLYVIKKKMPQRNARQTAIPAGPIYAPHGACILFSLRYFAAGGTLKYDCFLFGEELFVAETARQLGLGICYDPTIQLRHDEHKSTGWWRNRTMWQYHRQSSNHCYHHYFAPKTRPDA